MKRLLILWIEFVALTVPLTWAWLAWVRTSYQRSLLGILAPLYDALGLVHVGRGPTGSRFLSYVPFLVLMLITPALTARRRIGGTLLGFALILVSHVGLILVVDLGYATHGRNQRAGDFWFPALLLTDAMPILVWAVVARPGRWWRVSSCGPS